MATASRADQVRARRTQRREEKPILSRLGLGATKAVAEMPRMIARNPQVERKLQATEARRRHYLKLAETGAELRLPALPSVHVGWRLVSGLIAVACAFGLYAMYSSAAFTVNRVELRGAQRVDANAVNSALSVSGASIFTIQPDKLYEILASQFPELERVAVHVGVPGRVVVDVKEREPLISWEQAGLTVWVDAAGVAFIPQQDSAGLIQVEALEPPPSLGPDAAQHHQLIRPSMVTAIQALSRIAPQGAPLIYDPKLGFGWNDPGGWQAFFGQDGQDIDQRLAVYLKMLDELKTRRLIPTLISVAQLHAPYYRMDY
jgi:hypothetical protein